MMSKNIDDDITGSKGKELYSKIKSSLTNKYGDSKNYEYTGRKIYDEYDEFYQCLKYSGCGNWMSFWEAKEGGIVALEIEGAARGKGYLRLSYESKNWSGIINERKQKTDMNDIDSL